jgi:Phage tail protein
MHWTKLRLNGLTVVDLPIIGALPSDLYILKSVDGLGPPEIDVSIADTLNAGGVYQGRRPQSREIVAQVGLNPDYTAGQSVSDLRASLYGMLTPGYVDNVNIQIIDTAAVVVQTTGYVSKLEINPFSKDPEVQITIPCLQQYLQALSLLFLTPGSKSAPAINNVGTAPAGFFMEVIFTAGVTNWTLSDSSGKKMQFNYVFLNGDTLRFDTRPGSRGIWLVRAGVTTNIIYALSTDSIWYMLYGGNNVFATSSQLFNWGNVYFLPQYWGI